VVQDIELKTQKSGNSVVQTVNNKSSSATQQAPSKTSTAATTTTTTKQGVKKAEPEKPNIGRDVSHLGIGKVKSMDVDEDLFSFSSAATGEVEPSLEDRIKALTTNTSSGGLFD